MSVSSGAYSLTGGRVGANLIAGDGAYALTGGTGAVLAKGYETPAPAAAAVYTITGGAIGPFIRGHRVDAEHGEYHLTAPKQILKKTTVPIKDPAVYVEEAWELNEEDVQSASDLDARVTVDQG